MESTAVLRKCKYAFLTLPNYSLIAVANALEALNTMRYKGDWKEMSSAHVEEPVQPKEAPVSA